MGILIYLLIAGSFSISSYFFIHLPAIKHSRQKNDIGYSLAYLLASFILFPFLFYGWIIHRETLIEELYNGFISL